MTGNGHGAQTKKKRNVAYDYWVREKPEQCLGVYSNSPCSVAEWIERRAE